MNFDQKKLSLKDLKFNSIDEVINEMQRLFLVFEQNPKLRSLKSFIKVYEFVTSKVLDESNKGRFNNPKKLEILDIHFANLYFEPLYAYLEGGESVTPWVNYFKFSQMKVDPFVLVLIGINIHIDSDLLQCLVELDYEEYEDFMKVNEILLNVIPEIMTYLAINEKDIWGFGGLIFYDFVRKEFEKTVISWREEAWINYQRIKKNKLQNTYLNFTHISTENLSENILSIFNHLYNVKNITKSFDALNSLSVG